MALNALNKMLKSGGGLLVGERQTEEAAKNSGLSAPMTSPLGLSTLGVNPDAAKMGGSSQQKMAANKQSLAPLPKESTQVVATEADKKSRKQAQQVQGLTQKGSSLDSRVNNLVADRITQKTSGNTLQNTAAGLVTASGIKDKAGQDLFSLFLNSGGKDVAGWTDKEYEKLAKDLGIIAPDAVINTSSGAQDIKNKLKTEYFDPKTGKVTLAINSAVTIGDIKNQPGGEAWATDLGFSGEEELAEFLGIPVSQLATKSVKDLNDSIDYQVSSVFSQTAAQQAILNDPSSSDLEKQQAQASLGQLSGRGVIAGEQEASQGAEGLRGAETVAFKGKEYVLSDLLESQVFKDEFTNYYKKTPQEREALKAKAPATEKAMYEWMDKNEGFLKTLETETGKTLDIAQTATNEAAGAYGVLSGVIKDAKKLEQLTGIAGPTKFGQKKKEPTTTFGKMIESLAGAGTPVAAAQIKAISEFLDAAPPEYIDLLKDKGIQWFIDNNLWSENQSPDELKNKLMRWKGKRDDIAFLNGDNDVSQLGIPMNEFQDLVSSLATLGEDSDLQKMFDADKDGKLDSGKEITKRIKDKYAGEIGGNNPDTPTLSEKLNDLKAKALSTRDSFPQEIRDGVLDASELDSLKRGPLTFETLDKVMRPGVRIEGDVNQLVKSATYNHLRNTAPVVLDVLNDILSPSGGFRATRDRESVRGDLVNVQAAIAQLQGANVPQKGGEVAARLLNQLNDWASILNKANDEFLGQDEAASKKAEDEKSAAEKAQTKWDANPNNRIQAGIKDPAGAAKDTLLNAGGYITNPLSLTRDVASVPASQLKKLGKKVKF